MSKVYILTDDDFAKLTLRLDRDRRRGYEGGSSQVLTEEEQKAHDQAHHFFNYHVRTWMTEVTR